VATAQGRGQQGRQYGQEELEARLREALRVLMADGTPFRELSVARIIESAGVARSTFYTYFSDKAAMLMALSAHSLHRLYEGQRAWLRAGDGAEREQIVTGMRQLLSAFAEDEVVMRAVAETSAYDSRVRDSYIGGVEDYARAMARMIRAGKRSGRIRDVEPTQTAEALAWMCERTVTLTAPGASPARQDAIAEALGDIVWRTLFK
jgi:TetR/AcrR family transcriptional regulator, ethionamide resistance regulator